MCWIKIKSILQNLYHREAGTQNSPSPLTDVIVAIAGGKVQGCPAFVIRSTGVSSILQELLH